MFKRFVSCFFVVTTLLTMAACSTPGVPREPSSQYGDTFGRGGSYQTGQDQGPGRKPNLPQQSVPDFNCVQMSSKYEVKWDAFEACHVLKVSSLVPAYCLVARDGRKFTFQEIQSDNWPSSNIVIFVNGGQSRLGYENGNKTFAEAKCDH